MEIYTREIQSLQHPIIKHCVKLRKDKRYRIENKSLILEGKKMIFEYQGPVRKLLITKNALMPNHLHPKQTLLVSKEMIEKISGTKSPEPYLAEVPLPSFATLEDKKRILVLDGVSDPGNVGTLIRSALAFGFDGIFLTEDAADPYMGKTLRAAKGATFHLPLRIGTENDLLLLIQQNKLTPYIADKKGAATRLFHEPLALILGNESHGPSKRLKTLGTLLSIPISHKTESLNVAVAGSILMHQIQETLWPR